MVGFFPRAWRPVVKCCLSPNNFILSCGADLRSRLQAAARASQRLIDRVFRVAVSLPSFLGTNFVPWHSPHLTGHSKTPLGSRRAGPHPGEGEGGGRLWSSEEPSSDSFLGGGAGGDGSGVRQMRLCILVAPDFCC